MQLDGFFERKTVVSKYYYLLTQEKVRLLQKCPSSNSPGLMEETGPSEGKANQIIKVSAGEGINL